MSSTRPGRRVSITRSSIPTANCSSAIPTNTPTPGRSCEWTGRDGSTWAVAIAAFLLTTFRCRWTLPIMMPAHRNRKSGWVMAGGWLVLVAFLLVRTCRAETVTLHLRNGASVTGEMISLDTTFITITNAVLGKIAIPVVEVQRLEKKNTGQAAGQTTASPQPATATNQPPATTAAQTTPTNQPPARAA